MQYIKAILTSLRNIEILNLNNQGFSLFIDDLLVDNYSSNYIDQNKTVIVLNEDFDFQSRYFIVINDDKTEVDISKAYTFKEIDELFYYGGNDLGSVYYPDHTTFSLWAPLSRKVGLKLENSNGNFDIYPLQRDSNGVYRITVNEDIKGRRYHYLVEFNGAINECNDIYGKAVTFNSEYSVVVDINEIKKIGTIDFINRDILPIESIIYETHVRDFTRHKSTNIVHKGTFKGFVEKDKKTANGNPAGLDYLLKLGINTVQLQPVHDIGSISDAANNDEYNWGYDPISYFALEGTLSSDPYNPSERLFEFKNLINELHNNNIRVTIDVVYNHIYRYEESDLEKTAPGYYFRHDKNGHISNCSGCGNDIASERKMARKLILDSVTYLFDIYDIDGLRFDLMGLIDVQTMKEISQIAHRYRLYPLLYGEGWDMTNLLKQEDKSILSNAHLLPEFSFFNDTYRDIAKGPSFEDRLYINGFAGGDTNYADGFRYVFYGSTNDYLYDKRFTKASQSINFVECHDNFTLYDKYYSSHPNTERSYKLDRVNLTNALLLLSFGIPFIHMGQEIGLSKYGLGNTYNVPSINDMKWNIVDERYEMVKYFADFIKIRQSLPFVRLDSPEDIYEAFEIIKSDDGLLMLKLNDKYENKDYPHLFIIINVTDNNKYIDMEKDYQIINHLGIKERNVLVANKSVMILYRKEQ